MSPSWSPSKQIPLKTEILVCCYFFLLIRLQNHQSIHNYYRGHQLFNDSTHVYVFAVIAAWLRFYSLLPFITFKQSELSHFDKSSKRSVVRKPFNHSCAAAKSQWLWSRTGRTAHDGATQESGFPECCRVHVKPDPSTCLGAFGWSLHDTEGVLKVGTWRRGPEGGVPAVVPWPMPKPASVASPSFTKSNMWSGCASMRAPLGVCLATGLTPIRGGGLCNVRGAFKSIFPCSHTFSLPASCVTQAKEWSQWRGAGRETPWADHLRTTNVEFKSRPEPYFFGGCRIEKNRCYFCCK